MRGVLIAALLCACTRPNPFYVAGGDEVAGEGEGGSAGGGEGGGAGGLGGAGEGEGGAGEGGEVGGPGEGEGEGSSARPVAAIELVGPEDVREDEPFDLRVLALDVDGAPTEALRGRLLVTSDRGDVRPASVEVDQAVGGRLDVEVRLNREGAANLRVMLDGGLVQSDPWRVEVAPLRWDDVPSEPVLTKGERGQWDDRHVQQPSVVRVDDSEAGALAGKYLMYYRGRNSTLSLRGVGVAVSDDGVRWERNAANPVLPYEQLGPRSFVDYSEPDVHYAEGTFRMWLTGTTQDEAHIVHAVSDDGLAWERPADQPVLRASPQGDWKEQWVFSPAVVPATQGWHMWYGGFTNDGDYGIGFAGSDDGLAWEKHGANPVLPPGDSPQRWDAVTVDKPAVIRDGTVYRMWYTGDQVFTDSTADPWQIGYATSTDGIHWEKSPSNPVLSRSGQDGRFDSVRVANPAVVQVPHPDDASRRVVRMYFDGFDGQRWAIGLANPPGE